MSTFSSNIGPEEEDGAGWEGLAPTKAEREEEKRWERERKAKNYATTLAINLHAKHFPGVAQFVPLPDTLGLLTQIDNMVAGLESRRRAPLTDEQISNRLWEADWPESMLSEFVRAKLVALVRSVERAHGISTESQP